MENIATLSGTGAGRKAAPWQPDPATPLGELPSGNLTQTLARRKAMLEAGADVRTQTKRGKDPHMIIAIAGEATRLDTLAELRAWFDGAEYAEQRHAGDPPVLVVAPRWEWLGGGFSAVEIATGMVTARNYPSIEEARAFREGASAIRYLTERRNADSTAAPPR